MFTPVVNGLHLLFSISQKYISVNEFFPHSSLLVPSVYPVTPAAKARIAISSRLVPIFPWGNTGDQNLISGWWTSSGRNRFLCFSLINLIYVVFYLLYRNHVIINYLYINLLFSIERIIILHLYSRNIIFEFLTLIIFAIPPILHPPSIRPDIGFSAQVSCPPERSASNATTGCCPLTTFQSFSSLLGAEYGRLVFFSSV